MNPEDTKKRRSRRWWWWLLGILIALAVAAYLLFWPEERPCGPQVYFAGLDYQNPWQNAAGADTTYMEITFAGEPLSSSDIYRYYWDVREFGKVDSLYKQNGLCTTIPQDNVVLCAGLQYDQLEGLQGHEYTLTLAYEGQACQEKVIFSQSGVINHETLEHRVVNISNKFKP